MSKQLFAVVNVYEKSPIEGIKLLHEKIRIEPRTLSFCTEDGIMFDKHYFNLAVATYEGMEEKDERNN